MDDVPLAVLARFNAKLRVESTGCIVFTGSRNSDGYGIVRLTPRSRGNRRVLAHRLAAAICLGECPPMMVVDHHECGNRACVNQLHWRITTPEENTPGIYATSAVPIDECNVPDDVCVVHDHRPDLVDSEPEPAVPF